MRRSQGKGEAGFLGTDWSLVATSVIVGPLRAVDDTSITSVVAHASSCRAGVALPEGATIRMSLTVVSESRDGVLYAEKIQPTPEFRPLPPGR